MKHIIIFLILFFSPLYIFSFDINMSDYSLGAPYSLDMQFNNNKIFILSEKNMLDNGYWTPAINIYDGTNWIRISGELKNNNPDTTLKISLASQMNIDSNGNIWVSGYSLYCYKDNKWNEYYIDDEFRHFRRYEQFCIDKFNNIWITTSIYNDEVNPRVDQSELLKFNGSEFEVKLKTKSSASFLRRNLEAENFTISALPDGTVLVYKCFINDEYSAGKTEDLCFFKTDGTIEQKKLMTTNFRECNKVLNDIVPDGDSKIWFPSNIREFYEGSTLVQCCSGLSLLENGNWILFDENKGLGKDKNGNYIPIYRILKINPDNYLVIGKKKVYLMFKDYILNELNWYDLLDNATFIKPGDNYKKETAMDYIDRFINPENYLPQSSICKILRTSNGDIWFQFGKGIIVFSDKLLSVETNGDSGSLFICPNPVDNALKIYNNVYSNYMIFDILGQCILKGSINGNNIDVNSLQTGLYYIKLMSYDQKFKMSRFIKN